MSVPLGLLPARERRLLERSEKIVRALDAFFSPHVLRGLEHVLTIPTAGAVKRPRKIRILTKENPGDALAWSIGRKIRAARERKGWIQEDLANLTGMARANIARLEAGRHMPKIDTLRRVARVLDLDAAALLRMPDYREAGEDSDWLEAGMDEWSKSLDREEHRP